MHAFVVLGHRVPLAEDFTLNDLPGSAGRIDVLCRCVNAALFLSHDLRRDVEVFLVLQDALSLRICGRTVKRLNPDERSTAARFKQALSDARSAPADPSLRSSPGIDVWRMGLAALLGALTERGFQAVVLHEGGDPLRAAGLPAQPAFVLSDHLDFAPAEWALLSEAQRISVGPRVYPASHCIAVVNNELDLRAG